MRDVEGGGGLWDPVRKDMSQLEAKPNNRINSMFKWSCGEALFAVVVCALCTA